MSAEDKTNLRWSYFVIAGQEQVLEARQVAMRSAARQIELFLEDGKRERLTVALASLDLADKTNEQVINEMFGDDQSATGLPDLSEECEP